MLVDKTKTAKTSATQNEHIKCCNTHPFRYRSYYFDIDLGLYYLQSRYYVPEWCRWLNAVHPSFLQTNCFKQITVYEILNCMVPLLPLQSFAFYLHQKLRRC